MKAKRKGEKFAAMQIRFPIGLKKAIEEKAVSERRSINDQVIVLLEQVMSKGEEARNE